MTITLCNSHPLTFYLPFHTSLRADQCPIHVPSTCTLGLDPCARHSLFGRTDPYYIDNFFSSCGLKRPAAALASPFSVIVLSSKYLFQRGPIWLMQYVLHLHLFVWIYHNLSLSCLELPEESPLPHKLNKVSRSATFARAITLYKLASSTP